jgi:hypothetical protein
VLAILAISSIERTRLPFVRDDLPCDGVIPEYAGLEEGLSREKGTLSLGFTLSAFVASN